MRQKKRGRRQRRRCRKIINHSAAEDEVQAWNQSAVMKSLWRHTKVFEAHLRNNRAFEDLAEVWRDRISPPITWGGGGPSGSAWRGVVCSKSGRDLEPEAKTRATQTEILNITGKNKKGSRIFASSLDGVGIFKDRGYRRGKHELDGERVGLGWGREVLPA